MSIADATQGGICFTEAANMPDTQRKAAIRVLQHIREQQSPSKGKRKER